MGQLLFVFPPLLLALPLPCQHTPSRGLDRVRPRSWLTPGGGSWAWGSRS